MTTVDFRNDIRSYIACEIETLNKLDIDAINDALNLILETHENHKRVFVFGNGGSSATASHFYNDFVKGLSEDIANKFRFHCLTTISQQSWRLQMISDSKKYSVIS